MSAEANQGDQPSGVGSPPGLTNPPGPEVPYGSPAAMRAAIADEIKVAARTSTFTAGELRRQFAYDRLLARLFIDHPDRWVLKGGGGLLARLPQARHSLDLDLYHAGLHGDLDEAVSALRTAGATDLGDYFEFRFDTPTRSLTGTTLGATLSVTAHLGAKPFERFPVDVVVAITMTALPESVAPLSPITIDGLPQAHYRAYPIVDQVADKLCATISRYQGRPSSRFRDLPDLALIALQRDVDGPSLRHAIHTECAARGLVVPNDFDVPDRTLWARHYQPLAAGLPLLADLPFEAVLSIVKAFLDPVLADTQVSRWRGAEKAWR